MNVAYVTGRAYALGVLGRKASAPDFVSQHAWARPYGVTGTNVTLWRTLGHALVTLGWAPDSEAYRVLSSKRRAEKGDVRKYVTGLSAAKTEAKRAEQMTEAVAWLDARFDRETGAAVVAAVGTPRLPDGSDATSDGSDAQSDTGGAASDTGVTGIPANVALSACEAAVTAIERNAGAVFDGEAWAALSDRMMAVIEREAARHAERGGHPGRAGGRRAASEHGGGPATARPASRMSYGPDPYGVGPVVMPGHGRPRPEWRAPAPRGRRAGARPRAGGHPGRRSMNRRAVNEPGRPGTRSMKRGQRRRPPVQPECPTCAH